MLCAGAEMEYRKDLRERIDGQPEPDHLCGAAQPGSQFVQLEMWEPEVAEGALMQGLCVLASASQPGSDRGLPVLLLRRLLRLHVRSCVGSPAQHVVEHACDKHTDVVGDVGTV